MSQALLWVLLVVVIVLLWTLPKPARSEEVGERELHPPQFKVVMGVLMIPCKPLIAQADKPFRTRAAKEAVILPDGSALARVHRVFTEVTQACGAR